MKKYSVLLLIILACSNAFAVGETDFPRGIKGNLTGNVAGTCSAATALAADPSDCGANNLAFGIAANGNLSCSTVPDAALADSYIKADGTRGLSADWNAGAHTITASTFSGALTGDCSGTSASFTGSLTGDVTSTAMATTVGKIKGVTVDDTDKANGKFLVYNSGTGNLEYEAQPAASGGAVNITVTFNGTDTTKTVDTSGVITDSQKTIWQLLDLAANNYATLYVKISRPTAGSVYIESNPPLAAGDYRLVGKE